MFWYLDLYRVTLCTCTIAFRAVSEVKKSRQTTLGRFGFKKSILHRNSVMETKVPDFVSTMSRTIKCNHCSKLFVNQQGLSVHEKCAHGVSGMTKAAEKGIPPKKDPVRETESEIKIDVQDTLDKLLSIVSDESTDSEEGTVRSKSIC